MNFRAHLRPSDLQGLSRLAVQGVSGTTELVEQVHLAIARVSGPNWPSRTGRTRGITGLVYRSIQGITGLVGGTLDWGLSQIVPRLPTAESTPERDRVLAALNGVLGDYLEGSGNPLALTMTLRQGNSTETALPPGPRRIAVFIHGLCMSAHDWSSDPACAEQVDLPQLLEAQAGYQPLHLFYNSGRSIGANGRDFAHRLDVLLGQQGTAADELILIGHSMGGLVARSAVGQGVLAGQAWTRRVSRLITLGSPHHGAPLEKIGHLIERTLGLTPFSRPFARLGQMRSAGICDLRDGQLHEPTGAEPEHCQATAIKYSFPQQLRLYTIAGSLARRAAGLKSHTIGDGLVTAGSALGLKLPDKQRPPPERQLLVKQSGHLRLLHHPEVGARVLDWLRED